MRDMTRWETVVGVGVMDADARSEHRAWARHKWGEQQKNSSDAGDCHDKVERLPEQTQKQHANKPDRSGYDRGCRVIELADIKETGL